MKLDRPLHVLTLALALAALLMACGAKVTFTGGRLTIVQTEKR